MPTRRTVPGVAPNKASANLVAITVSHIPVRTSVLLHVEVLERRPELGLVLMPDLSFAGFPPRPRMGVPRKGSLNGPTAPPMTTATGTGASRMVACTRTQKRRIACRYGTGPPAVGAPEIRTLAGALGRGHRRQGDRRIGWLGHSSLRRIDLTVHSGAVLHGKVLVAEAWGRIRGRICTNIGQRAVLLSAHQGTQVSAPTSGS